MYFYMICVSCLGALGPVSLLFGFLDPLGLPYRQAF